MMKINIDVSETKRLQQVIDGLPQQIKQKAMSRALNRIREMAKTRIVKRSAEKVNLQQKHVRRAITTSMSSNRSGSALEFLVRARWVRVADMDPRETKVGLSVRFPNGRGSYRQAFLAKMKGDLAAMRRVEGDTGARVGRFPLEGLFAANIANAIHEDEEYFVQVLTELIVERFQPRLEHEIGFLLSKVRI